MARAGRRLTTNASARHKIHASIRSLTSSAVALVLLGVAALLGGHLLLGWLLVVVALSAAATAVGKGIRARGPSPH